jgi:electron transfer flavoprotein beta subunit
MHVIVCVKQVPDPEIPPSKFKIDTATKQVVPPPGVPPVVSVFDERAVEAACRLKDKNKARITAITIGPASAADVIKNAFKMGADEGVHLLDKAFDNLDGFGTAFVLSRAVQKIGAYDVILCGRQAADWDSGQVGSILGEMMGIPVVSIARDIKAVDNKLRIERVMRDGYQAVEAPMPCLVTVSNEIGLPRLPSGMGIIAAARKKITVWTAQDIQTDSAQIAAASGHSEIVDLVVPSREAKVEIVTGTNTREAALKLASKLREANIV